MTASTSAFCPSCNAIVGDDEATCTYCGTVVNATLAASRAPLILPGSPAFSIDVRDHSPRLSRLLAGGILGVGVVLVALFVVARRSEDSSPDIAADSMTPSALAVRTTLPSYLQPTPSTRASASLSTNASATTGGAVESTRADSASARTSTARTPADEPRSLSAGPSVTPRRPVTSVANGTAGNVSASTPGATQKASIRATNTATTKSPDASSARVAVVATKPAVATPQLRMTPLVSNVLRPGQLLRLRGTVLRTDSRRSIPMQIRYSSADARIARVNARTGEVVAVRPGRVRVIADAGAAGRFAVELVVVPPGKPAAAIAARVGAVAKRPPAATSVAPAAPITVAPITATIRPPVVRELPDGNDARIEVDRLLSDVRNRRTMTPELSAFFADGADHRIVVLTTPSLTNLTETSVRMSFDMRLTKYDGAGRPMTRVAPVSYVLNKRDGSVSATPAIIGALRRP